MNYLGHAFLSLNRVDIITGNMIADHLKGKLILEKYPVEIKAGVLLHRKIDDFTDKHNATIKSKLLFKSHYGLYSGAIIDTLYDHFLANDSNYFQTEKNLQDFSSFIYSVLDENANWLPEKFALYFKYMKQQNWLYNYRNFKGVEQSLKGLSRRAEKMPPIEKAYEIFITNYYQLNQNYFEFITDIYNFVSKEIKYLDV